MLSQAVGVLALVVAVTFGVTSSPAPASAAEVAFPLSGGEYAICGVDLVNGANTPQVDPGYAHAWHFSCNYGGSTAPTAISVKYWSEHQPLPDGWTRYLDSSVVNDTCAHARPTWGPLPEVPVFDVNTTNKTFRLSFCSSGTLLGGHDIEYYRQRLVSMTMNIGGTERAVKVDFTEHKSAFPGFPIDHFPGGTPGAGPTAGCVTMAYWPLPLPGVVGGVPGTLPLAKKIDLNATWLGSISALRFRWDRAANWQTFGSGSYPVSPSGGSMYQLDPFTPAYPVTIEDLSIECVDASGTTMSGQVNADGSIWWGSYLAGDITPCARLQASDHDPAVGAYDPGQTVSIFLDFLQVPNQPGEALVPWSIADGPSEAGPFTYRYDQATGSPSVGVGSIALLIETDSAGTLPGEWWIRCVNVEGGGPQFINLWDLIADGLDDLAVRDCAGEASVGLHPSSWVPGILRGIGCLFIPRAEFMTAIANDLQRAFEDSALNLPVELLRSVTDAGTAFIGAANGTAPCTGPSFVLPLGGGQEVAPLDACPGSPMASIAGISKVVAGAGMVIGCAFALIGMFGGHLGARRSEGGDVE